MRHIAYLLLLANVLYLAWNLAADDQPPAGQQAALPPLPDQVQRLVTLQEFMQAPDLLDAGDVDVLTRAEPPGALPKARCTALGPFRAEADTGSLVDRLKGLGIDPVLRSVSTRVSNGYWIYVATNSNKAAQDIVRSLEDKGDKDYFIGKDFVVSLGTFDGIARADIRHREVLAMGLDAVLEERFRSQQAYWLELPASAASRADLQAITADSPGLELHNLSCR